jgi:hypothetical protein
MHCFMCLYTQHSHKQTLPLILANWLLQHAFSLSDSDQNLASDQSYNQPLFFLGSSAWYKLSCWLQSSQTTYSGQGVIEGLWTQEVTIHQANSLLSELVRIFMGVYGWRRLINTQVECSVIHASDDMAGCLNRWWGERGKDPGSYMREVTSKSHICEDSSDRGHDDPCLRMRE